MQTDPAPAPKRILETQRLALREMTIADAPLMLEILNEPAFIEFVADRGVRTNEQAEQYIRDKVLASFEQFGFGFYVVELKSTGEAVGMCGLIKRESLEDVDVGFSVLRRYWGHGYATEAARALMEYGRTAFRIPRIIGITAPENIRSSAVLEKLGLRFEKMIQLPGYGSASRLFS